MRNYQQKLENFYAKGCMTYNGMDDAVVEFMLDSFNEEFLTLDQVLTALEYNGITRDKQSFPYEQLEDMLNDVGEYTLIEMFEDFMYQDFFSESQCREVLEYLREFYSGISNNESRGVQA